MYIERVKNPFLLLPFNSRSRGLNWDFCICWGFRHLVTCLRGVGGLVITGGICSGIFGTAVVWCLGTGFLAFIGRLGLSSGILCKFVTRFCVLCSCALYFGIVIHLFLLFITRTLTYSPIRYDLFFVTWTRLCCQFLFFTLKRTNSFLKSFSIIGSLLFKYQSSKCVGSEIVSLLTATWDSYMFMCTNTVCIFVWIYGCNNDSI